MALNSQIEIIVKNHPDLGNGIHFVFPKLDRSVLRRLNEFERTPFPDGRISSSRILFKHPYAMYLGHALVQNPRQTASPPDQESFFLNITKPYADLEKKYKKPGQGIGIPDEPLITMRTHDLKFILQALSNVGIQLNSKVARELKDSLRKSMETAKMISFSCALSDITITPDGQPPKSQCRS